MRCRFLILLGALTLLQVVSSVSEAQFSVLDATRISEENAPVASPAPGQFGWDSAPLGDLDGDGNLEIAVGHPTYHDADLLPAGGVWILSLDSTHAVVDTTLLSRGVNNVPAMGDYTRFGTAVEPLGDLNGDGVVDVAVGANLDQEGTGQGALWILFLNTAGEADSTRKLGGGLGGMDLLPPSANFGISLSFLGDQDSDGRPELAVGATGGSSSPGIVWILSLNPDGTVYATRRITEGESGLTADLDPGDAFGSAVAALGDLDGNGARDLAVGATYDDDGAVDAGAVWILFLNTDGSVAGHQKISATAGLFPGPLNPGDGFGNAVDDLGCDGQGLAVGAIYDDDGGPARGAVWVLYINGDGTVISARKISQSDPQLPVTLEDLGLFGRVSNLGDINGDGATDLGVGAPQEGGRGAEYILYMIERDCGIAPLDFGVVTADSMDTTVVITNASCVPVHGFAAISGTGFSIVSGGGNYTVDPAGSHPVVIRFMPPERGVYNGLLDTGSCGTMDITAISEGELLPCPGDRWNVSDFNAANLDTTQSGNRALWCGGEVTYPGLVTGPGYGNLWDEATYLTHPVSDTSDTTDVRLQFVANHDLAPGDNLLVETVRYGGRVTLAAITGNNRDGLGEFTDPAVFDISYTAFPSDYIDIGGGTPGIVLILRVTSDGTDSDEDGLTDTDGAVQIDNIDVSFNQVQVSFADFEPGGSDGGWCTFFDPPPLTGDFKWSDQFGPYTGNYPLGMGLDNTVNVMEEFDGSLVAGGAFHQTGPTTNHLVAAWNGLEWSPLGNDFGNGAILALEEHNGSLVAGGSFLVSGTDNVAIWDGLNWGALGQGLDLAVLHLVSFNGDLYAVIPGKMARWTGSTWQEKNLSIDYVFDIEVYDNQLFVAGSDQGQGYLGTWTGSNLVEFPGASFNGICRTLHVNAGLLYVGGDFDPGPPGGSSFISVWDGTSWSGVDPVPQGPVDHVTHYRDRLVSVSGSSLASYENGLLLGFGTNPDGTVMDAVEHEGSLYVGGGFTSVGGKTSLHFGRWTDTFVVGVEPDPTPTLPMLSVNRPNPFQASTRFSMNLEEPGRVKLVVFDLSGRRVRTLMDRRVPAGRREAVWDGRDDTGRRVASGIYLVRLGTASATQVRKVTLIR